MHTSHRPLYPLLCRFQIDRRKYHPVPQVHGAVVEFALRPEEQRPAVPSERGFLTLVGWVGCQLLLHSFSLVEAYPRVQEPPPCATRD